MLVFLNKPPLTPPANTVSLELSLGSNINPFVLPPTFPGPLSFHFIVSDSPGTVGTLFDLNLFFLNSYCNSKSFSGSGFPSIGFIESSHIFSEYLFGGSSFFFLSFLESSSVFEKGLFSKLFW